MKRKMKIGIIGTGNIGAALTRHFTRLEHEVEVANSRGPETLAYLAKETGAKPGIEPSPATGSPHSSAPGPKGFWEARPFATWR